MTRFRYTYAIAFGLFASMFLASGVAAQQSNNPLDYDYVYPRIGAEIGLSSVWQDGEYHAGCGVFEEGAKLNPIIAIAFDMPFNQVVRFEALAGFQGKSLSSSYNSRESLTLSTQNAEIRGVDVDFENVGSASFSYLFVQPSVKFYPIKELYGGVGASVNLLMSATTQYTKNILSRTVDVGELGLSEVYYSDDQSSDPYSMVFEEETRDDADGIGFDAVLYAGAEFEAGEDLKIGPRIQYTLPLIPVITEPELKLNSLQFLIGIRYDI